MTTNDLTVIEASGNHAAHADAVKRTAATWLGADVLVHTETTGAALKAIIAAGWDERFTHRTTLPSGKPGEILIAWNPDTMHLLEAADNLRLTDIKWKVAGIVRDGVTAGRVRLTHKPTKHDGVIYGVHLPSGIFNFPIRSRASKQATAELGRHIQLGLTAHPDRWRLAAGDTNEDHHRALIRKQFQDGLHLTDMWGLKPAVDGSHGSRLIDAMFVHRLGVRRTSVLAKTAASDHRAIRLDATIGHASPPPGIGVQAAAKAKFQSEHGPVFGKGECLERVHDLYGIGPVFSTAAAAWAGAQHKHPETDPTKIPSGFPTFWLGGSEGDGHVAEAQPHAKCWSTDILRTGFFDLVDISLIHQKWGLTLVGWTEDLNGVMVS
jgi:hypothetical protein